MGNINVYSGPMKSGKTQEILNEYKRQLIAGRSVQMFKPLIDTRNGDCIAVRNGINIPAVLIKRIADLKKYDVDAYFIDEFQFLKGDVSIIQEMADNGKSKDKFNFSKLDLSKMDPRNIDWTKLDPRNIDWEKLDPRNIDWSQFVNGSRINTTFTVDFFGNKVQISPAIVFGAIVLTGIYAIF